MYSYLPFKYKINSLTYELFIEPLRPILIKTLQLLSRGDRPLQMTFENQLNALIYFHLQEHTSGRHLIQDMKDNEFARQCIAPEEGISRSSFSEAINSRGLELGCPKNRFWSYFLCSVFGTGDIGQSKSPDWV